MKAARLKREMNDCESGFQLNNSFVGAKKEP
jgi:hypothetical protein